MFHDEFCDWYKDIYDVPLPKFAFWQSKSHPGADMHFTANLCLMLFDDLEAELSEIKKVSFSMEDVVGKMIYSITLKFRNKNNYRWEMVSYYDPDNFGTELHTAGSLSHKLLRAYELLFSLEDASLLSVEASRLVKAELRAYRATKNIPDMVDYLREERPFPAELMGEWNLIKQCRFRYFEQMGIILGDKAMAEDMGFRAGGYFGQKISQSKTFADHYKSMGKVEGWIREKLTDEKAKAELLRVIEEEWRPAYRKFAS